MSLGEAEMWDGNVAHYSDQKFSARTRWYKRCDSFHQPPNDYDMPARSAQEIQQVSISFKPRTVLGAGLLTRAHRDGRESEEARPSQLIWR